MLLSFQIILALLYLFKNMMKMAHFNLADASAIITMKVGFTYSKLFLS